MKFCLLTFLSLGLLVSLNCSGDGIVVEREKTDIDFGQSLNMPEDPGPQYPPEYGLDEFTPPFTLVLTINIICDSSYSNRRVIAGASIIDFYA